MPKPTILSAEQRAQLILSAVEESMTKIARIGTSPTRIPLTPAAIEKRHREARAELRREIERLVRGRGRDMLSLVRQYAEADYSIVDVPTGAGSETREERVVSLGGLLAVIDAGFVAEDEPVAGERCPLCERGMTEHTRIDLYGTDAYLCSGSTRDGVIVNIAHPQALARLHAAATEEAQRQFDELTKGNQARVQAEDYAAILDVLAALPEEQLEGIEATGWDKNHQTSFAPTIAELLTRGPVLERERLEGVVRDAVRQSLRPLNLALVDLKYVNIDDVDSEVEYAERVAELVANLLKAIFPVRVEYVSQEESERIERARKGPLPLARLLAPLTETIKDMRDSPEGVRPELVPEPIRVSDWLTLPPLLADATHWLIGNDYGLFYKVDAAGNVTRLDQPQYTQLHDERHEPQYVEQTSNMRREYLADASTLTCPCGNSISWKGVRDEGVNAWIAEHKYHAEDFYGKNQGTGSGDSHGVSIHGAIHECDQPGCDIDHKAEYEKMASGWEGDAEPKENFYGKGQEKLMDAQDTVNELLEITKPQPGK